MDQNSSQEAFEALKDEWFLPPGVNAHPPLRASGNAFEDLLGRTPNEHERARLLQIQKTLNLQDNDDFWLIVLSLQYHLSLYEEIPSQISQAAHKAASLAVEEIQNQADHLAAKMRSRADNTRLEIHEDLLVSFEKLKKDALRQIAKAVRIEIGKVQRRTPWAWFWIAATISSLVVICVGLGALAAHSDLVAQLAQNIR